MYKKENINNCLSVIISSANYCISSATLRANFTNTIERAHSGDCSHRMT